VTLRQIKLGLVGFGEVGSGLAKGLRDAGLQHISAFDTGIEGPFAELIRTSARASTVELVGNLKELADRSDIILSSTPGRQCVPGAEAIAPFLRPDHLYVDLASATPKIKIAALEKAGANGATVADAGVGGSPLMDGHRIEILVCGPGGETFRDIMVPWGMNITHIGPKLGSASAIKIFRSVIAKGLEAVVVECILGAEKHGISEEVLQSYTRFFTRPFGDMAKYLIATDVIHARRRAEEAEMSAEALRDAGVDPIMTDATVARLLSVANLELKASFGGRPPQNYADAVAAISAKLNPE
jgi:3-hydroxyisobutyrate dehydrogenase-like beta-hydroxyacid dehydrogenase